MRFNHFFLIQWSLLISFLALWLILQQKNGEKQNFKGEQEGLDLFLLYQQFSFLYQGKEIILLKFSGKITNILDGIYFWKFSAYFCYNL